MQIERKDERPACRSRLHLNSLVADSLDALAKSDAEHLEQIRESLREFEEGRKIDRQAGIEVGVDDLTAFARVLQATETTIDLIARYRRIDSPELEYLPRPANRGSVTRN